jgi:hypothetical protein
MMEEPYISLLDREAILDEARDILRKLVVKSRYYPTLYVPLRKSYRFIALSSTTPVERSAHIVEPGDDPSVILAFLKLPLEEMVKHVDTPGNLGIIAKLRLEKGI